MTRWILLSAGMLALIGTAALRAKAEDSWSDLQEQTVKAGIYAKEQADRGKETYDKICSACHTFKPSEKSKDNPDLGGDAFLTKWDKKTVHELATVIYTTMPNDGSAVITEEQTADVVAFILQQNNFPAGAQPFKWDASARKILIVK
jgi:mono/diheme cytochrome c family protein